MSHKNDEFIIWWECSRHIVLCHLAILMCFCAFVLQSTPTCDLAGVKPIGIQTPLQGFQKLNKLEGFLYRNKQEM